MTQRANRNLFGLIAIILVAACLPASTWAGVQLQLDRNRIVEGETVTLTFHTDDASQSLDADFSALEKDFLILDTRKETQLSIVDGRQAAVVRLLLTVEPRRAGELQIPAIGFGPDQTRPVTLVVEPAPELEPGALPPVFIEVEVNPDEGPLYVHAQFGLVVRVFYQQNLTEAAISQPEPAPASVRLLQETPYQAERAGERYRVLERNYAIFPERSGELVIPAMELSGRLVERRASGVWQPQVRGRRIRATSDEIRLQIEPKPAGFTGAEWQPARQLNLSQQVSSADALRVGEPVTRTVLVDAVGLEENMIVEPAWPELSGARIYPDQPQGITRDDGRWVLGHKEFRYAVVPEEPGELVLPALKLVWWDTVNHVQRSAELPAHTLQVQPSMLVPPSVPEVSLPGAPASGQDYPLAPLSESGAFWRRMTLLFALLWLLTAGAVWLLWRRVRAGASAEPAVTRDSEDEADLLRELRKASEQGNRAHARSSLQRWLRVQRAEAGRGNSILDFAGRLDEPGLRSSIYALDGEGFNPGEQAPWDGMAFWSKFEAWRKKQSAARVQAESSLIDLYARNNRRA